MLLRTMAKLVFLLANLCSYASIFLDVLIVMAASAHRTGENLCQRCSRRCGAALLPIGLSVPIVFLCF